MDNDKFKLLMLAIKETRVKHADTIEQIEREVNQYLQGDATVGEVLALMIARGWIVALPATGGET